MTATFKLGRVAGVEIGIHWSWLVIFVLITWSLATAVFPHTNPGLSHGTYTAMAVTAVPLFFGSLILHELGHAIRAAREGMVIAGITLWIFGGIAQFRGRFPSAGAEFRIAIAGPLVSLAIGGVALAVAVLVPLPAAVDGVAFWLGYINLLLLAFNMLPALPLDGGRVLRAALWARSDDFLGATRRAAVVGQVFGQGLIVLGVLSVLLGGALGGLWFVFIGWFLLAAAEAERVAAETHAAVGDVRVGDAMVARPVTVEADATLDEFMQRCFFRSRHVAYPVVDRDRVLGLISFRAVLAEPRETWARHRVRDRMVSLDQLPALSSDTPLEEAVEVLAGTQMNRALVMRGSRLEGMLSITDAARLIEAGRAGPRGPRQQPGIAATSAR